jgi:hypothetical protein
MGSLVPVAVVRPRAFQAFTRMRDTDREGWVPASAHVPRRPAERRLLLLYFAPAGTQPSRSASISLHRQTQRYPLAWVCLFQPAPSTTLVADQGVGALCGAK